MSNASKKISQLLGKAARRYNMLANGDHVLVAVSGGKDSVALLYLLIQHQARVPINYTISAVHVDPGFGVDSAGRMERFFSEQIAHYRVLRTGIGPMAHSSSNRENPCFLCSRLRRKLLFETAEELGCNKIAFGHHKDDVIETFFLNVLYGGSLSTMMPVQDFFDGKLSVIRPFYMVDEHLIEGFACDMGWSGLDLGCPTSPHSKRKEIKDMLAGIYRTSRKAKGNVFHALHNVRADYLPVDCGQRKDIR